MAVGLMVSEYQYIDVSGTRPRRDTSRRRNTRASMSMITALPRCMTNLNTPVTLGPSSSA
ncbi:hypothetical protein D3C72_1969030 [compost metagenome]